MGNGSARPKIGLVLGGGGALGFAHVGVLRALEAQRVPIDFIAGTSMGAIIGGLYAGGMSPDEIQSFLESLDWTEVMNDETPRRELYFRRKREDQRYLFELGLNFDGPKLGTGMASGQKFINLLQWKTLRSAHITDFDQLPIPYRAMATDLRSGTSHELDRGNLATAMRASMAVPGIFTPVELDGRILVDGGVTENLPVEVVKAMGAEIVIAVDVGSAADKVDPERLRTLGGILRRTYAVSQRPRSLEQLLLADVGIQPELNDFLAPQFQRVSELIPLGEQATLARQDELAPYGVDAEAYDAHLARQRRPLPRPMRIEAIHVSGHQRVDERLIRGRIFIQPGEELDERRLRLDLMRVYGIGEFERVLFRLDRAGDGTGELHYDVREKAWGPLYLAFGLRLQSDFEKDADWTILVNVTRRSLNALGAEWRNELEAGSVQGFVSEFYQPLDPGGIVFIAPTIEYRSVIEKVYSADRHIADYDVRRLEGRLDIGIQLRHYAELRAGPVWGGGKAYIETGTSDLPRFDETYAGWSTSLILDRQDRTVFAREGYYLEARGLFAREAMGGDRDFDRVKGVWRHQQSIGNHTFTAGFQGGTGLGRRLPGYSQFTLGGPFGFSGLAEGQFRGSYLGVASLGYRYRLLTLPYQFGRGIYAITRLDCGNVWAYRVDVDDVRYGATVGIGADTVIGPIYLTYGAASGGHGRFYFSLGTVF